MKWPTLLIEPSAVGVKYTIPLARFLSKLFSCPLKFIWAVSQKKKKKKKIIWAQISNWFGKNPNKKNIWHISIQTQITKQLLRVNIRSSPNRSCNVILFLSHSIHSLTLSEHLSLSLTHSLWTLSLFLSLWLNLLSLTCRGARWRRRRWGGSRVLGFLWRWGSERRSGGRGGLCQFWIGIGGIGALRLGPSRRSWLRLRWEEGKWGEGGGESEWETWFWVFWGYRENEFGFFLFRIFGFLLCGLMMVIGSLDFWMGMWISLMVAWWWWLDLFVNFYLIIASNSFCYSIQFYSRLIISTYIGRVFFSLIFYYIINLIQTKNILICITHPSAVQ